MNSWYRRSIYDESQTDFLPPPPLPYTTQVCTQGGSGSGGPEPHPGPKK